MAAGKRPAAEVLAEYEAAERAMLENQLMAFEPYPKQIAFAAASADYSEIALRAGNQQGKTHIGAAMMAIWLTGQYPKWWKGRRWDRPVRAWACGESATAVRDVSQNKLCGPPGNDELYGTGMIPKAALVGKILGHGAGGSLDKIMVRHVSGGTSELTFKSYDQERSKWQGATLDIVWCDEEPPVDHYMEALARLIATHGLIYSTFTPLIGMNGVLPRFEEQTPQARKNRLLVAMNIDDAKHLADPEVRAQLLATFSRHQRRARVEGLPLLGSGGVFDGINREQVMEPAIPPSDVPLFWSKLWGIDFGINHPFAAVLTAWDKDADCLHVLNAIRVGDENALQHAAAMTKIAAGVPVAWPRDGHQRDKGSGIGIAKIYKGHGLNMLADHAHHPSYGVGLEASIMEMVERARDGRLKVAAHLTDWWQEFESYHRKDGLIVPINDDLMSATRYAMMMRRHGHGGALGSGRYLPQAPKLPRPNDGMMAGFDDNPFDWYK